MSGSVRPARWWEIPERRQRSGDQGTLALAQGSLVGIECPVCKSAPVVYNGNYFCDNWVFPGPPERSKGECDWALAHPATTRQDRAICDLIGIDYE